MDNCKLVPYRYPQVLCKEFDNLAGCDKFASILDVAAGAGNVAKYASLKKSA